MEKQIIIYTIIFIGAFIGGWVLGYIMAQKEKKELKNRKTINTMIMRRK